MKNLSLILAIIFTICYLLVQIGKIDEENEQIVIQTERMLR